jgi:hypothetical protein
MNEMEITQIVEQFSRKIEPVEGKVKLMQVPDYKTVNVEHFGEVGRSILLREYKVDGKIYWAGYSSRSDTVFVSQASQG